MRRLGLDHETVVPDKALFEEFQMTFTLPLSPLKHEAMKVLFPGRKQLALGVVCAA